MSLILESGLVDVSSITKVALNDEGLLPQPVAPKFRTCIIEVFVPDQKYAIAFNDKSLNRHRYDSIPIANGLIKVGLSCQLIHYTPSEHDQFFTLLKAFDGILVRCSNVGIFAAGGDQNKFDDSLREVQKLGISVWTSPDVRINLGSKNVLSQIRLLDIGLEDTFTYTNAQEFENFRKTMAFAPRVVKQNRGSTGDGIFIVNLVSNNYCSTFGERYCKDDETLDILEACNSYSEQHTVGEFMEFCVNGRTDKSGVWNFNGVGKYFDGTGNCLVDQRFLPRIKEGETRVLLVSDIPIQVIRYIPKDGISNAISTIDLFFEPDCPEYRDFVTNFTKNSLPRLMSAIGLPDEPYPLLWSVDFIAVDTADDKTKYVVNDINCTCVGISICMPACCSDKNPNATWNLVPEEDKQTAGEIGVKIGGKVLELLEAKKSLKI